MDVKTSKTDILKKCLNRKVKDIYVTGYSELRDSFNFFSTMPWWYYIEFDDFYLFLESDDSGELLSLTTQSKIQCNFEIEEGDIFTVMSIGEESYSNINSFDLFYDRDETNIYALGISFDDDKYIFFNSLTWNGVKVENKNGKEAYLNDNRFHIETIT